MERYWCDHFGTGNSSFRSMFGNDSEIRYTSKTVAALISVAVPPPGHGVPAIPAGHLARRRRRIRGQLRCSERRSFQAVFPSA